VVIEDGKPRTKVVHLVGGETKTMVVEPIGPKVGESGEMKGKDLKV